jgi:hypothetical protein
MSRAQTTTQPLTSLLTCLDLIVPTTSNSNGSSNNEQSSNNNTTTDTSFGRVTAKKNIVVLVTKRPKQNRKVSFVAPQMERR